ncbi:phosphotransferase family protein [Devosia sp. A16]|uniref:phosphotransferase family protein n=1 Tax=Devosia sp. A16 TaxID=1736675 RepID=UPI0006D797A5|nr:phosphotransferase [Devosia sp. A16]
MNDVEWIAPDPDAVAAALAGIGIRVDPAEVKLLPRDNRFAGRLPDQRIAWFPTDLLGKERLARESRALALIERYCRFRAPRTIYHSDAGWYLRREVPGTSDPFATYQRVLEDRQFAATLGGQLGRLLADQHLSPPRAELGDWLLPRPGWPPPVADIAADLPRVTGDRGLIDAALALLARHEAAEQEIGGRVLAHTDFGFHNMVVTSDGAVAGVFDYDEAALTDRHYDFRYLLLDDPDDRLLLTAIEAYLAAGGQPIELARIHLLNAASAVAFLAFRSDAGPDEKPAGRTLAEDLRWTRLALARAGQ